MTTTIESRLQHLGFGEYESRALLVLYKKGPLNGYRLAKESGIPRANIYSVLKRLEESGAVTNVRTKGGSQYAAEPPNQLVERLAKQYQSHLGHVSASLKSLAREHDDETAWNIRGYETVIDRAQAIAGSARKQLLVALWSQESRPLAGAFLKAKARRVEVTTLCIQGCKIECGSCQGHTYRYPLAVGAKTRWLIVASEKEALVGQVFASGEATAAVSRLEVIVSLAAQYIRNAIAVGEIVRSMGSRLLETVDSHALAAINGAILAFDGETWFDQIRSAVIRDSPARDVERRNIK